MLREFAVDGACPQALGAVRVESSSLPARTTVSSTAWSCLKAPVITSISPVSGSTDVDDNRVTIRGTALGSGQDITLVMFGSARGQIFFQNQVMVMVLLPRRAFPETVNVTVYSYHSGASTVVNGYTFLAPKCLPAPNSNGHCYQVVTPQPKLTWSQAMSFAAALTWRGSPGYLAMVTGEQEYAFVSSVVTNTSFAALTAPTTAPAVWFNGVNIDKPPFDPGVFLWNATSVPFYNASLPFPCLQEVCPFASAEPSLWSGRVLRFGANATDRYTNTRASAWYSDDPMLLLDFVVEFDFFTVAAHVTPVSGPLAGGTIVTITANALGSNYDITSVTLAGTPATILGQTARSVTVRSGSFISAMSGNVVVQSTSNGTTTSPTLWTYNPLPLATQVVPPSCAIQGGSVITIIGSVGTGTDITNVAIAGVQAQLVAQTSTAVTVIAPPVALPGRYNITIWSWHYGMGVTEDCFYYLVPSCDWSSGGNGHCYTIITPAIPLSWSNSRDLALTMDFFGHKGYLSTITSLHEWQFVHLMLTNETAPEFTPDVWLGATSSAGIVRWMMGLENNTVMFNVTAVPECLQEVCPFAGGEPRLSAGVMVTGGGIDNYGNSQPYRWQTDAGNRPFIVEVDFNVPTWYVTPSSGPLAGGSIVTITSLALQTAGGINSVTLNGIAAAILSQDSSALVCRSAGATTAGTGDIVLTPVVGAPLTIVSAWTYQPASVVTWLWPQAGRISGGVNVTIFGTNLGSGTDVVLVYVAGVRVQQIVSQSDNMITATIAATPGLRVGAVSVVSTHFGTATSSIEFSYVNPTIVSVLDDNGPASGGAVVTISGITLGNSTDLVQVSFCGVPATILSQSTSSVTVQITEGVTPGTLCPVQTVSESYGSATLLNSYRFNMQPHILAAGPRNGHNIGGYNIVFSGTNLGNGSDIFSVQVAGVAVNIISQTADSVTVSAPITPLLGLASVTVNSTHFGMAYNATGYFFNPYCAIGTFLRNASATVCDSCAPGTYSPNAGALSESSCLLCDAGQFANTSAMGFCYKCEPGTYSTGSAAECTKCVTGTFSNATGASSPATCVWCAAGSYNNITAATVCDLCEAGLWSSFNATVCTQCDVGRFSNATGSSGCYSCSAGSYNNVTGITMCSGCAAGLWSSAGATNCTQCASGTRGVLGVGGPAACVQCTPGTFNNQTGSTVCDLCEPGFFSRTGATNCTECFAGTFVQNATCAYCPAGSFSNVSAAVGCTSCEEGYYAESGATVCTACAVGTYWSQAGDVNVCLNCTAGSYTNSSGLTACSACARGLWSEVGMGYCNSCERGTYGSAVGDLSVCVPCSAGTYSANEGLANCTACDLGHWANSRSYQCTACATGSYAAGPGDNATCIQCSAGAFTNVSASTMCTKCDLGYWSASGDTHCTACLAGNYANVSGDSGVCRPCASGSFSANDGSTRCETCLRGSWSTTGRTRCEQCAAGTFSADLSASQPCAVCPAGSFSNASGASGCSQCEVGYWAAANSTQCTACSAGTYSNVTSASQPCAVCPAGSFSNTSGASGCSQCEVGYWAAANSTQCTACGAGTYSNMTGSTSVSGCFNCSAGYFSNITAASTCSVCELGSWSNASWTVCSKCPIGSYSRTEAATSSSACVLCAGGSINTNAGSTSCTDCGAGYWSLGGASICSRCTAGTYSTAPRASAANSCVSCTAGSFSNVTAATRCGECPAGSWSDNGALACTACVSGTASNVTRANSSSVCVSCPVGYVTLSAGLTACSPCHVGTYSPTTGSSTCQQCPVGSYCAVEGASNFVTCADGHTTQNPGAESADDCHPLAASSSLVLIAAAGGGGGGGLLVLIVITVSCVKWRRRVTLAGSGARADSQLLGEEGTPTELSEDENHDDHRSPLLALVPEPADVLPQQVLEMNVLSQAASVFAPVAAVPEAVSTPLPPLPAVTADATPLKRKTSLVIRRPTMTMPNTVSTSPSNSRENSLSPQGSTDAAALGSLAALMVDPIAPMLPPAAAAGTFDTGTPSAPSAPPRPTPRGNVYSLLSRLRATPLDSETQSAVELEPTLLAHGPQPGKLVLPKTPLPSLLQLAHQEQPSSVTTSTATVAEPQPSTQSLDPQSPLFKRRIRTTVLPPLAMEEPSPRVSSSYASHASELLQQQMATDAGAPPQDDAWEVMPTPRRKFSVGSPVRHLDAEDGSPMMGVGAQSVLTLLSLRAIRKRNRKARNTQG
eukprot:TRINITY_DN11405_c0_g1_i11.p1 TRINITY_DN11405_c0_g1~~TRINITY_DN11405_c0_g1_i11.p1  ORF type:complete len:2212 (+),score=424.46 TRINITY_DN11405_c0_g1_i11:34-6669(+)